jgi:hypothetical protein
MASIVKIKRSSVQGKAPTTSDITTGEIALNIRDGKLFSSDGSSIFEVGANNTVAKIGTLTIGNTTPFTLPTTDGSADQVLTTDGSGTVTWADSSASSATATARYYNDFRSFTVSVANTTFAISNPEGTVLKVFQNGIRLANSDYTANTTFVTLDVAATPGDILEIENIAITTEENLSYKSFTYTANTNQTLFAGTDDYGVVMGTGIRGTQVFLNGVLLTANTDYTIPSTSSVSLSSGTANNDIVVITTISPASTFIDITSTTTSNSYISTSGAEQVVDSFAMGAYRTAKYIVQITDNANSQYQSSEVLLLHNNSTVQVTEYASLTTDITLGTIDADISANIVRLKVTPTWANSTIKTVRTAVAV